jgi:uncharacterized membrane protein
LEQASAASASSLGEALLRDLARPVELMRKDQMVSKDRIQKLIGMQENEYKHRQDKLQKVHARDYLRVISLSLSLSLFLSVCLSVGLCRYVSLSRCVGSCVVFVNRFVFVEMSLSCVLVCLRIGCVCSPVCRNLLYGQLRDRYHDAGLQADHFRGQYQAAKKDPNFLPKKLTKVTLVHFLLTPSFALLTDYGFPYTDLFPVFMLASIRS